MKRSKSIEKEVAARVKAGNAMIMVVAGHGKINQIRNSESNKKANIILNFNLTVIFFFSLKNDFKVKTHS